MVIHNHSSLILYSGGATLGSKGALANPPPPPPKKIFGKKISVNIVELFYKIKIKMLYSQYFYNNSKVTGCFWLLHMGKNVI